MQQILRLLALPGVLVLAGCASAGGTATNLAQGSTLPQPNPTLQTASLQPAPAQQIATAQSMTDVTSFIDPAAIGLMSARERTEAASAQFNALQFGRPGAPRSWQGDRGATGSVTVGPYVRVNNIDCRDFTHTVAVSGQSYVRKGTACRELDGRWSVAS
jgi:surface antigen